jgi:hypothetical protein
VLKNLGKIEVLGDEGLASCGGWGCRRWEHRGEGWRVANVSKTLSSRVDGNDASLSTQGRIPGIASALILELKVRRLGLHRLSFGVLVTLVV